jgi:hypothetical protein
MLAGKEAREGIHQDWEGGHATQPACLAHRKDPLHSAVTLLVVGPLYQRGWSVSHTADRKKGDDRSCWSAGTRGPRARHSALPVARWR